MDVKLFVLMVGILPKNVTEFKLVQPPNELLPIVSTEAGIVIFVKLVQPLKALLSMPVIKLLRTTVVKFVLLIQADAGTVPA